MSKLHGRFYFKLTSNGNLLGEYSNNDQNCLRSLTESARRLAFESKDQGFVGNYISAWYEDIDHQAVSADLVISLKPRCENIFLVRWTPREGEETSIKCIFFGEAMIGEGMLVGNYHMQ